MNTPRQHFGGPVPAVFSAFFLLFLLGAAVAVASSLSTEASLAGVLGPSAYVPECDPDWVPVPSPHPGTGVATLNGVAAVSADDAWAVGYYENSSRYQTLVLHWDGSTWSVVPSPNVGTDNNSLGAITAVAADNVWAVGSYGDGLTTSETLILHWDGSAWSVVPSPGVGSSLNLLSSVAAVSADDVWSVGYYVQNNHTHTQTLTEHWDGSSWSIIPSPNPGTAHSVLRGVTAVSSNDAWAVGFESNTSNNYRTLTEHWDGSAWSVVPSPSIGIETNLLFSVDAVSANDIWAVGFYYNAALGQTLIEHWDGSTWSVIPSPDPGISHILKAVAATSVNDVWAVGYYEDDSSNNQALVLHWNGSSWSVSSASTVGSTANELYGVAALSANDAWAVGDYSSGGDAQPLVVQYEPCPATPTPSTPLPTRTSTPTPTQPGASPTPVPTECVPQWTVVDSPNVGTLDNELRAVAVVSATDIWAVGYSGNAQVGIETLTEHWDGTQWSVVPSPNLTSYVNFLHGVAAISSDDVWAVGFYKGPDLNDPSETMTIHWDGSSWSVVPSVDPDPQSNRLLGVTAISSNDVWAVGFLQDYDGVNEVDLTITEHWDGTSWSVVPSPNPSTFTYLYGVTASSSDDVWAVGLFHSSKDNALAMHWDGSTWHVVAVPNMGTTDNDLYAVTIISADDVWAVGAYVTYPGSNSVQHTLTEHWDGTSWSIVSSPDVGSLSNTLNAVAALSPNDIWAVGEYSNTFWHDQTLTEHWDGTSWSVVSSPSLGTPNWLLGVATISSSDIWAVGLHEGVYRTLTEHYSSPCGTPAPTLTPTSTFTPTSTPTSTPLATSTPTGNPTNTSTSTPVSTGIPTSSPVPTAAGTSTEIATVTVTPASATDTPTATNSPVPTAAGTSTETATATVTITPASATDTPTATNNPVSTGTPTQVATATVTPPIATGTPLSTSTPTTCNFEFADVLPGSAFYQYIRCLVCRGIVSGYSDGTFRPGNNVTRGQAAKIIANSADYQDPIPANRQTFNDVSPASTFWVYIERVALHGAISGYECGGQGEPCPGRYFRPTNNLTRGQLAKIDSEAFGYSDPIPPDHQTFNDVPPDSAFWLYIERLTLHSVISGYSDGTFRANSRVTRGQAAKIVSLTFLPECSTP